MLAHFLAGGACAVGILVAVSVTPAAAHPYDQYIRGRSFFGTLFGPSIARGMISYPTNHKPGTIVVSTAQRRLYLVLGNGQALSYAIGVGKAGFVWSGVTQVTDERQWPEWPPPDQMLRRPPDLPHHMAGGPDNPMGARGIYLGASLYRIHGSNEPDTIGQAVLGVHPLDQRGRDRPLQPRAHRRDRHRAVADAGQPIAHGRRRRTYPCVLRARQRVKPLPARSSRYSCQ